MKTTRSNGLAAADLVDMTTYKYKKGFGSSVLRFVDTNELIVSWPHSIAPTSHLEACEEALRLTREQTK